MPVRIPTYRSRTAWVTGLATVIAALVGAAWTRMILRRVPSSTGDFEGLHLER